LLIVIKSIINVIENLQDDATFYKKVHKEFSIKIRRFKLSFIKSEQRYNYLCPVRFICFYFIIV